jgi:hypothetical protein
MTGTADLVLCGGADLHNGINGYLLFSSVHALSPTGRCRTFDSSADGITLGEGVACLALKRLSEARNVPLHAGHKLRGSAEPWRSLLPARPGNPCISSERTLPEEQQNLGLLARGGKVPG